MYRPHVPNFIQIGQEMCKVPVEIHLGPYVKRGLHLIDLHETHKCSSALRTDLMYRISPRSVNKCERYL